MSDETHCVHCGGPLGTEARTIKRWVVGGGRWLGGREACKGCWNGRLRGSLLYQADVCHADPCRCGWCFDWKKLKEASDAHRTGNPQAGGTGADRH